MKMRGTRFQTIALSLGILFSSAAQAYNTIEISSDNAKSLPINAQGISGAQVHNGHFFVTKEGETTIYKAHIDFSGNTTTTIAPHRDLTTVFGKYAFSKALNGKKYDPEGLTSCTDANGIVFYVVNEVNGDIIRTDSKELYALPITYADFPKYKYDEGKDGFMGITADCTNKKLYVAKLKNPNVVFAIDLNLNKVVAQYDLSTGSDTEDDISDLFFYSGKLYVLQKNINHVAVVNPATAKTETRYDFESIAETTMAKSAKGDQIGIAEALIVRPGSILLFLDQRKSNKANNDSFKDVIVELKI